MTHEGFTPADLFKDGPHQGQWLDFDDRSSWFRDPECTIPADTVGDYRYCRDKSGNGNHFNMLKYPQESLISEYERGHGARNTPSVSAMTFDAWIIGASSFIFGVCVGVAIALFAY